MVGTQVFTGVLDLGTDVCQELVVDDFSLAMGVLIEIEDFDQVGAFASQFLVSDDVDVQLVKSDLVGLRSLGGFEVNNRGLVGVESPD